MANETLNLTEFGSPIGEPIRYTIGEDVVITKGQIMKMSGAYTVAAAEGNDDVIAGIAVEDHAAGEGRTAIGCATKGIYDVLVQGVVDIGEDVVMSGAAVAGTGSNVCKQYTTLDGEVGYVLGKALEGVTATNQDTIAVKLTL